MTSLLRVRVWIGVAAFALLVSAAVPAFAQNGTLAGRVITQEGKPMAAVPVILDQVDGKQQKKTVTDNQGEWVVTGLPGGSKWTITVVWKTLSGRIADQVVKPKETVKTPQLVVSEGGLDKAKAGVPTSNLTAAEADATAKKNAALQSLLKEADAAVAAGNFDEGIEKFTKVANDVGKCAGCYVRIGDAYLKKKDPASAEKAFLQAIEFDPKMPEPYLALANLYNDMKKFDEATKMVAKANELMAASGTADPATMFNQGVILWNQGKGAEAQPFFEKAVQGNPKMADAHYFLGMSLVNQGKLAEAKAPLTEYMKLDPKGKYAATSANLLQDHQVSTRGHAPRGSPADRGGGRARGPRSGVDPPDRRVQDHPRRARARRPQPRAATISARIASRKASTRSRRLADLAVEWHLIGHLQSNKAKKAAGAFAWIQSIDSQDLLSKIDRAAGELGTRPKILIQVDLAHEATKHGADAAAVRALVRRRPRRAGGGPSRADDRAADTR